MKSFPGDVNYGFDQLGLDNMGEATRGGISETTDVQNVLLRRGKRENVLWDDSGAPIWPTEKCGEFSRYLEYLAANAGLYPIDVKSFAEFKRWDSHDRMWERVNGTIDWSVPETLSKQHKIRNEHGVDDGQWVKFVDNLDRVEMKENAAINVNNMKQKKISHTTGTLTYAAKIYQWLSLEQKEAEKRNQNIDITLEVVEDIYADVFGVEKRNRIRGMGTG
ncbi:uncharacterized protein LOC133711483 [Rosa rugosa]|uniref:uncharacterized protein LOC133711483 n=1 Tax=Rosa rugosa TaxID=74645 RepID=UPI002B411776|nr:uncharacterized protein LOC133711483 [Rosa rugosa]